MCGYRDDDGSVWRTVGGFGEASSPGVTAWRCATLCSAYSLRTCKPVLVKMLRCINLSIYSTSSIFLICVVTDRETRRDSRLSIDVWLRSHARDRPFTFLTLVY